MADFPLGYDNRLALELGSYCQLAYDQFTNGKVTPPAGFTVDAEFTATSAEGHQELFGFLMHSAAKLVLSFRGTDSPLDLLDDFEYAQVACPFPNGAGQIHVGFSKIYASCRAAVAAALAAAPPALPLFVTGHSLGGALAELAAFDAAVNSPFKTPTMVTIASPRAGDPDFAAAYNGHVAVSPPSSWRVCNMRDVVPMLPPERIFDLAQLTDHHYQHPNDAFRIDFRAGNILENHKLVNYQAALTAMR